MPLQKRVVDYFVVLRVAQTKVESSGRFKQIGLPLVVDLRFPVHDFGDAEFPSDLGCFAFPDGATFVDHESALEKQAYSFVLTEGDGGRIYCQALRYWKEINVSDLAVYGELYGDADGECQNLVYEPFIMIFVSHWPFLNEFESILDEIYVSLEGNNNLAYPVQVCLTNLIYETPLPPRGRRMVEFTCYNLHVIFSRPAPNQLPLRGNYKQFNILFHTLSLNNIITCIIAMLCEKRMLFYSENIILLTPCIESLCSLIFPFYWQHIYVPVLPSKFTDFIYAPMPFICGVLPSYLPPNYLSLLEGVVFIDLDANVVKFHSSDPIPKFTKISSNKDINKLVSNPKKILPATNIMQAKEVKLVRNTFIKFFAKFLKSYKICMNPSTGPSKDKFNKEKWIDSIGSDYSIFLNLFITAQAFECFIDERFDASANINNYEVLYFDEKIDETIHNKPTPFLLDTTFLHKKNETYLVPVPIGNTNTTQSLLQLSAIMKDYKPIINKPVILVSSQDLTTMPSMHISWMSVEFFKQKQLYDRHWHSLETRINSQNILFRQIFDFFMKWQDSNNKYISDLELIHKSLANVNVNVANVNTANKTSLNKPWSEFTKYISNYFSLYQKSFVASSKKSFIPIMESVPSMENELSVIIETARNCESQTAKTKCQVEFANKNLLKYTKRLADKQSQLHKNKKLHVDDFLTAIEQKDKYEIEHVESTSTFLTNLEIFTTSMPNMIDDVKKISKNRLINFKQYLFDFIESNQSMHQEFAEQLKKIKELIQQIDPEQDIEKFIEGKMKKKKKKVDLKEEKEKVPKRYSISRELSSISSIGVSATKRLTNSQHLSIANIHQQLITKKEREEKEKEEEEEKEKEAKLEIVTDDHGIDRVKGSIFYSDNLWGTNVFQVVLSQCDDGKNVIKGMIRAVEDLCDLWDLQSRSLNRCCQAIKLNINLSAKELEIWKELYALTEKSSLLYRRSVLELRESVFELRITKGELKSISKLLQRKKGELGSEVQFATRNVQLAYDERNACLRIYRQTQSQWKSLLLSHHYSQQQLLPLLQQMSLSQLNFKQSDMKWNQSKNILRSVKQKEDLCNGVILDTFREKEINRQSMILIVISNLVSILFKSLIYAQHRELSKFMLLCLDLNVNSEIDSFIDREITSSAAMLDKENIRWTAKSVEVSWISSKNGIDSAKAMLDFFHCRISATEQYIRNFNRRQDWNTNKNKLNKFAYSLNDLFLNFNKFIADLSSITLDFLFAIKNRIEPLLNAIRKSMEAQNSSSHELIAECNSDFNKLEEKLAKSVIECRRLETSIDSLKTKICEKEMKKHKNKNKNKVSKSKSKKRTFKIFEKSKEQLQSELSSTQNKLKQEISNRDRLKAQLQQKSKYRDVLFSKVITDFIRHEEYRLKMNKYIYCIYSKINEESLIKMHTLTTKLKQNVETIIIRNNLQKFVIANRSSQNVPKIVLDHAIFKMSSQKDDDLFNKTRESMSNILALYSNPNEILNNKLIFDHNATDNVALLDSKEKETEKDIVLNIKNITKITKMSLPKMKKVSSNQQISKHLLEYVTRHSMKGGKHARIDSLHSISRSTQPRKLNIKINHMNNINMNMNNIGITKIDEQKEDHIHIQSQHEEEEEDEEEDEDEDEDDDDSKTMTNVQRIQQSLFASGLPKPQSTIKKRKK